MLIITILGLILMENKIKFIDLFAGIGGIRIGFENNGFECVYSNEINDHACEMYEANFGCNPKGDITKLNPFDLPEFDILVGGFPCQAFSICGKQKGFEDARGTLFFDVCRILEAKKPKVFMLENVFNLVTHDKGRTFRIMQENLKKLGYSINYRVLNARDFGVPQNRERIIIVGNNLGKKFDFDRLETNRIDSMISFLDKEGNFEYLNPTDYTLLSENLIRKQEKSGLLFVGYRNKKIRVIGVRPQTEHLSRVHKMPNRIYSAEGTHPTIASQETSGRYWIYVNGNVRKLTINECYRFFGFPENFRKTGLLSKQYERIGNSVCVNMISSIAKEIRNQFFTEDRSISMKLEEIYIKSMDISNIMDIPEEIIKYITEIGANCQKKKGLYTVLTTLLYYKVLHPSQDIRYHQDRFEKGFSGRSFDTNNVTPILKKLGLPAMAESGWLTRSLEQPYPYDMNYNGSIGSLKLSFLKTLEYVEQNPSQAFNMLRILLHKVDEVSKASVVEIVPLENPENLTIDRIISALSEHFMSKYNTHNGAKLPVLAFYSIYLSLVKELKRYEDCNLAELSSLTACDKTNKASGDIEIFKNGNVFESIEIKLDKKITAQIIRVVETKIYKWNPQRYYVLSVDGIESSDKTEIEEIVSSVLNNHGCQIIINGLIPTLKYYLRLVENLNDFIKNYSMIVQKDNELQKIHKEKWSELINKYKL